MNEYVYINMDFIIEVMLPLLIVHLELLFQLKLRFSQYWIVLGKELLNNCNLLSAQKDNNILICFHDQRAAMEESYESQSHHEHHA